MPSKLSWILFGVCIAVGLIVIFLANDYLLDKNGLTAGGLGVVTAGVGLIALGFVFLLLPDFINRSN